MNFRTKIWQRRGLPGEPSRCNVPANNAPYSLNRSLVYVPFVNATAVDIIIVFTILSTRYASGLLPLYRRLLFGWMKTDVQEKGKAKSSFDLIRAVWVRSWTHAFLPFVLSEIERHKWQIISLQILSLFSVLHFPKFSTILLASQRTIIINVITSFAGYK